MEVIGWCNITTHAVEQFIRRWAPNSSHQKAAEELTALLATSKKVGKTERGDSIFVSGHRPEIRMVVKDRNVCVTVLPPGNNNVVEELEEFEQIHNEYKEKVLLQIAALEAEISSIDEQRKYWNDKKHKASNELFMLRRQVGVENES